MASALRAAVGKTAEKVTGGDTDDAEDIKAAMGKYLLKITAGPSYDLSTHSPVFVNTDTPTLIENEFITAKIKVRIRGFEGLPRGSQNHSAYFDDPAHTSDRWSIGFSFVPKRDLVGQDTRFGADTAHPVRDRLPPKTLMDMGIRIFQSFIDPGASIDAYGDEPYLLGPTLSTWYVLRIGEKVPSNQHREHIHPEESSPTAEGADGESATKIREEYKMPAAPLKRRKHFLTAKNSEGFVYEKDRLYTGDFHNPYIDFQEFKVKLPGLSIGVAKYINDKTHVLRWVFKNIKTGDVYFVVCFTLLHGDDVDVGLREDRRRREDEKEAGVDDDEGGESERHEEQAQAGAIETTEKDLTNEDEKTTTAKDPIESGKKSKSTDRKQTEPQVSGEGANSAIDIPIRSKPEESQTQPQPEQQSLQQQRAEDLIQNATGTYKPGSAIADTEIGKEMLD